MYDGSFDGNEVQLAVERINDRAIEFVCSYPDLEWAENAADMSILHRKCRIDFVERVLATNAAAAETRRAATPSKEAALSLLELRKDAKIPLQEISTPRIANKMRSNLAVEAWAIQNMWSSGAKQGT